MSWSSALVPRASPMPSVAGLATQILQTVGLLLAGGILLSWVCWKIWRELRAFSAGPIEATEDAGAVAGADADGEPRMTLVQRSGRSPWPTFSISLLASLGIDRLEVTFKRSGRT